MKRFFFFFYNSFDLFGKVDGTFPFLYIFRFCFFKKRTGCVPNVRVGRRATGESRFHFRLKALQQCSAVKTIQNKLLYKSFFFFSVIIVYITTKSIFELNSASSSRQKHPWLSLFWWDCGRRQTSGSACNLKTKLWLWKKLSLCERGQDQYWTFLLRWHPRNPDAWSQIILHPPWATVVFEDWGNNRLVRGLTLAVGDDFEWSSWFLRWAGRPSGVFFCLWRWWGERCPDSTPPETDCHSHRPAATTLADTVRREAFGRARSSGGGRWNPGLPGWRRGSSRRGSWSPAGRCSGRSPRRSRPGREMLRSVARTSPRPGSTGQRSATPAPRGPALERRTQDCPTEGGCGGHCLAEPRRRSPWAWPLAGRWSCGPRVGSRAKKRKQKMTKSELTLIIIIYLFIKYIKAHYLQNLELRPLRK